jgi:hypothetical protein
MPNPVVHQAARLDLMRFLRATAIPSGLLVCSSVTLGSGVIEAQDDRPIVVFVHGRGQLGRNAREVRTQFVNAFNQAQQTHLGTAIVPDSDIAFVWYADVIDTSMTPPPMSQSCSAVSDAESIAMWKDWRSRLIGFAQSLGLETPVLNRFMNDTYTYLSSVKARCEADSRLELELAMQKVIGRPLIVVAHSMGGIVSFASIRQNATVPQASDRLNVTRFVTLGTQVGVDLILEGLLGSFTKPPVPEPNTILGWRNFLNEGDKLAFVVGPSFQATNPQRRPVDISINATGERHAATTYLSDSRVVRAILWPWCRAFPPKTPKPAGCAQIEKMGDVVK